jgi:hypothetical protein
MTAKTLAPAFTRRHYQQVAEALNEDRERFDVDGAVRFGIESAAKALCDVFAADNPRFDRDRFLAAVGVER